MMLLYNFCYHIYFWLKRMRRSSKTGFLKPAFTYLCDQYSYYFWVLLNRKYPKYFKKHPVKYGLNTKKRDETYTISFTSFPARIEYVHLVVETLLRQSFKPDRIVLWLSSKQFPNGVIPESLEELKEKGLTVRFCEDIRSHKKYYHTFKEYPDDNVIIVDDDMFYPTDMVKTLVKLHKKNPKDIVCLSAQVITPSIISMPSGWCSTENCGNYISRMDIQAFTGAGSLFPAHWYPKEVFNIENIKNMALTADDLWLKAMSIINGVKTTKIRKHKVFNIHIDIENNESLYLSNSGDGDNLNDIIWENLLKEYSLEKFGGDFYD